MAERTVRHLAQVNIALPRAPLDGPELADFMALLDPVNRLADGSPGFVWRLQTESGNATEIRPFDDDRLIVNLTVWESLEALRNFVYASRHLDVLRRRREWFHRLAEAYQTMWWLPAGTLPTVAEAKDRLAHLRRHGPSPDAFTFRDPFPPPEASRPAGAARPLVAG
jgi:heme-degrading monooxygenase HmoA